MMLLPCPYELLCFPSNKDTAIFASIYEDRFKKLMDKVLRLDEKLLPAVAAGGSDFVFLGGPGAEMISPAYYEKFLVPYSKIVTDMAHKAGLLIYSHTERGTFRKAKVIAITSNTVGMDHTTLMIHIMIVSTHPP